MPRRTGWMGKQKLHGGGGATLDHSSQLLKSDLSENFHL